jgi:hypothetical protein
MSEFQIQRKIPFKNEGKIKTFSEEGKKSENLLPCLP